MMRTKAPIFFLKIPYNILIDSNLGAQDDYHLEQMAVILNEEFAF